MKRMSEIALIKKKGQEEGECMGSSNEPLWQ